MNINEFATYLEQKIQELEEDFVEIGRWRDQIAVLYKEQVLEVIKASVKKCQDS